MVFILWSLYLTITVNQVQKDVTRFANASVQFASLEKSIRDFEKAISESHRKNNAEELKANWTKLMAEYQAEMEKSEAEADKNGLTDVKACLNAIKPSIAKINDHYIKLISMPLGTNERFAEEDAWREEWTKSIDILKNCLQIISQHQRLTSLTFIKSWQQLTYIVLISCALSIICFVLIVFYRRDIAERKRAENELRASEIRFAKTFHSSPYPILVFNILDEKIVDVNESFTKMTGYCREELIRKSGDEVNFWANQDDRAKYRKYLAQSNGKNVPVFEAMGRRKDGTLRNMVLTTEFIELDGKPCVIVACDDVTEIRESEKALRESEERFFKAFVSNPYPMTISEVETGKFLEVNESFARYLDYSREELIGQSAIEIGIWHSLKEREAIAQGLAVKGFVTNLECGLRNKQGRTNYYLLSATLIDIGGKKCALGAFVDVTERKRAQARQNLQYSLTRIFAEEETVDSAMPKILQATCENLGWEAGERFHVDHKADLLRLSDVWIAPTFSEVEQFLPVLRKRTFKRGEGFNGDAWESEQPIWSNDIINDPRTINIQAAKELGVHGAIAFPISANKTVTDVVTFYSRQYLEPDEQMLEMMAYIGQQIGQFIERKEAESALKISEERLQQSQKMEAVGRLAGGIAHDFNNILTAITGYSDLTLRKLPPDSPLRRNIEGIKKAAKRAAELTSRLLAFSRKSVLQLKTVNLNETVSHVDQMLGRLIGEDIQLLTVLEPKLWPTKTDPTQIELALLNLAVNARDAMPSGGKMTIETANVILDENYTQKHTDVIPGKYVMLAVSDTGHGMDEETQSHIFEPFFTTKQKGKGTGLGLSTVYGIVKQSKGHVSFYTELGKGTTFKVYLPSVQDETVITQIPDDDYLTTGWETILLVEDEEAVRESTKEILILCGYNVIEAENGLRALEICAEYKEPIHLVLTDVVMPRMNGSELATRLLSILPHTKILFMSGYTDDAIIHHGVLEEGINFIEKPFTPDSLARKIREVLG